MYYSIYPLYLRSVENDLKIELLILNNFKNYTHLDIKLSTKFIGFTGENGVGKTNILDAIYYTCMTKSYFNSTENYNITHDCEGMSLQALLVKSNHPYKVSMKILKGKKKEISINQVKEEKLIEFVGKFPIVMITPDDNQIILNGSEERRKMMDNILCQSNFLYTQLLIQYNKILANRNALLKQINDEPVINLDLLDTVDLMLDQVAQEIFEIRNEFVAEFSKEFERIYNEIAQEKEQISVKYKSHLLGGNLYDLLKINRKKDMILQRTTRGIHLDDLEMELNDYPLKKVGSQGQQKTFIVSMKLALYHLLSDRKKVSPILLLDDIFEKLDESRVRQLFNYLSKMECGQVFVTDTHVDRIEKAFGITGKEFEIFKVENGNVEKKII